MAGSDDTGRRKRVFSGMQPSGEAHLGNYLGALRRWVGMQDDYDCIWCIVDQHAITAGVAIPPRLPGACPRPGDLVPRRRARSREGRSSSCSPTFHEHTELAWLFNAVTPVGDLERMTQFKDKSQRFESIPSGIFNYPILQAADILLYKADARTRRERIRSSTSSSPVTSRGSSTPHTVRPSRRRSRSSSEGRRENRRTRRRGEDEQIARTTRSRCWPSPEEVWGRRFGPRSPTPKGSAADGSGAAGGVQRLHPPRLLHRQGHHRRHRCPVPRQRTIGCVDCKRILSDNIVEDHFEPFRERAAER